MRVWRRPVREVGAAAAGTAGRGPAHAAAAGAGLRVEAAPAARVPRPPRGDDGGARRACPRAARGAPAHSGPADRAAGTGRPAGPLRRPELRQRRRRDRRARGQRDPGLQLRARARRAGQGHGANVGTHSPGRRVQPAPRHPRGTRVHRRPVREPLQDRPASGRRDPRGADDRRDRARSGARPRGSDHPDRARTLYERQRSQDAAAAARLPAARVGHRPPRDERADHHRHRLEHPAPPRHRAAHRRPGGPRGNPDHPAPVRGRGGPRADPEPAVCVGPPAPRRRSRRPGAHAAHPGGRRRRVGDGAAAADPRRAPGERAHRERAPQRDGHDPETRGPARHQHHGRAPHLHLLRRERQSQGPRGHDERHLRHADGDGPSRRGARGGGRITGLRRARAGDPAAAGAHDAGHGRGGARGGTVPVHRR